MKKVTLLERILAEADVRLDGSRPWDIRINNSSALNRALLKGMIGIGDSYVNGDWDCQEIDELVDRLHRNGSEKYLAQNWLKMTHGLIGHITNTGSRLQSKKLADQHYNLGNDLFRTMLDPRLVYTCAYWENAESLAQAQERKLDLVCRKAGLKPGMRVLDIGGGWGSFAKFAAEKYGVSVVNITVSKEQVALANELCHGLPIENRLADYRDINEPFDAIVSLGMFEHVGPKNHRSYMKVVERCLKDDGLFLLHTIGSNTSTNHGNPWIEKYIFMGVLPSLAQINAATEGIFVVEDIHNFGSDYDKTLMAWWQNFDKGWPELQKKYGDRFYRMWKLYLQGCAGGFRARNLQLWQIVLSKSGVEGGYTSIR